MQSGPFSFLSPYHVRLSEEEEAHMHALEQQLLQSESLSASAAAELIPFHYVASALERARSEAKGLTRRETHINIVSGLMHEALAHPTHSTLQVLALLRVLLPARDSRSVYGFKTTSLVRSFAKAIEKDGGVSGKAAAQKLLQMLKNPHVDADGTRLVVMPEVPIALAQSQCFISRANGAGGGGPPLTLIEVAALCQKLTNIYKERHKQAVLTVLTARMGAKAAMSVHIDSVAEVLGTVLRRLDHNECMVLVRLLLRVVPMGIGPETVMQALGPPFARFLHVQQDLGRLAMAIVKYQHEPTTVPVAELVCGVPMTPMTCHTTSSPYVMKWLFTKQDTVKKYLSPKTGQLIIHSTGPWYVPLKSSGRLTGRNRFVDLESPEAVSVRSRKAHMLLLREIRRHSPALFVPDMARGYVISYTLSLDEQQTVVMLLLGVDPVVHASKKGPQGLKKAIEFVDASVVLDDPKQQQNELGRDADDDEEVSPSPSGGQTESSEEDVPSSSRQRATKRKQQQARKNKNKSNRRIQEILESMLSETARSTPTVQTPRGLVRISLMMKEGGGGGNRIGGGKQSSNNNNSAPPQVAAGIVAQRKMDGDRMQAHIMHDAQGKPMVRLFTKRGHPVHMLYTDVANDLKELITAKDQPCILDGEIVVIDPDTNKPLPWCSTKWRYDSGKNGKTLDALTQSEQRSALTVVDGAGAYGYNPDDDGVGEGGLTFAPSAHALSQWSDLGASERERLKVKALPKGQLMFVVFDVLMHRGVPLVSKTCRQRLEVLQRMTALKPTVAARRRKHVMAIQESWFVKNAEELVDKLNYIVREKGEGLVLKDPDAPYEFTRSMHQRKLKICGPDINCGVVGLGFTLSRNPHQWGLLTCIAGNQAEGPLLVYNRVEVLEGDSVKTAAEHVLGLTSLVSMHDVLHFSSSDKPLERGPYQIFASQLNPSLDEPPKRGRGEDPFAVTWLQVGRVRHTVYFLQGAPKDIQWLCNPFECQFGLSQRGDVYPVDWAGELGDAVMQVQVPRFPVGRIQLNDHQRSAFDSPGSIEEKFREAADEKTCIQRFIKRKVQQLRKNPPQPQKLEEIRRMLMGMEDPTETWPKVCPTTFYLDAFSELLSKHGHAPLNLPERMVLSGVPKGSQWDALRIRQIPLMHVTSQESTLMEAQYEADKERLTQRLLNLKRKANRTYFIPASSSLFPHTGANFADRLLHTAQTAAAHARIKSERSAEDECFSTTFSAEASTYDDYSIMQAHAMEGRPDADDVEEEEEEEVAFYMDAEADYDEQGHDVYVGGGEEQHHAACEGPHHTSWLCADATEERQHPSIMASTRSFEGDTMEEELHRGTLGPQHHGYYRQANYVGDREPDCTWCETPPCASSWEYSAVHH